jgi:transposase
VVLTEGAMEIRILKRRGVGAREIARRAGLSRNTVKRYFRSTEDPVYAARPVIAGKVAVSRLGCRS